MKLRRLLTIIAASFFVIPSMAFAQNTIINEQTPAERCGLAQNYLKNIQKPRDLRARVDRLQAYRYIHQRLTVFVVRLEKNEQPAAAEMRTLVNDLAKKTEQFKDHYEQYDKAREQVVSMQNCTGDIEEFEKRLAKARADRRTVSQDVNSLQQIISQDISHQLKTLQQLLAENKQEVPRE